MATGPAVILNESNPDLSAVWQLLRSPTANLSAITAAKLSQAIKAVTFAEDNVEFIEVHKFRSIAIQCWGVAANTNTFTIELYTWAFNGPGHHLQQMANNTFGNFVSEDSANAAPGFHSYGKAHASIRAAFAAGTDYRAVGGATAASYLLTASKDFSVKYLGVTPAVQIQTNAEADFPAEFIVDFRSSRPHYFGLLPTAQTGTSVGAIFKPLEYW